MVQSCEMKPPWHPQHPPWQLQISMRAHICQVSYVILLWKLILADLSADLPHPPNASWDIYYGMYLADIVDSLRKGGNFLLFLNNYTDEPTLANGHPPVPEQRWLAYRYKNLADEPTLAGEAPQYWSWDDLHTTTQNLADEPTLG